MTPLRQGYPRVIEGCQTPDALGNVASESPPKDVSVHTTSKWLLQKMYEELYVMVASSIDIYA